MHKIYCNLKNKELASIIIDAIQDKKGLSICDIDLSRIMSAPSSEFIICQGKTPSQTTAIADNVIHELREKAGLKASSVEGYRNGLWIILDYGSVMVHVFTQDTREFYNLEDLWEDGKVTHIPDLD